MREFNGEVTIRRRRFANADNGFAVLDAEDGAGGELVLVGPLVHLEERERVHVIGTVVTDRRYGEQVKVSQARPLAPTDAAAISAYLRRVRHVGRKRAEALIERFGPAGVLDAIDREPGTAFRAAGLSAHRAQEAAADWHTLRSTRQLHMLLAPHGLAYLVNRIDTEYGASAYRVLSTNPYELTRLFGVGFATADRIAHAAGVPDGPWRTRAGLIHLLVEAERSGSTCLPASALLDGAGELLGREVDPDAIAELVGSGDLVVEAASGVGSADAGGRGVDDEVASVLDGWVYRTATAELEAELADRIAALIAGDPGTKLHDVEAITADPPLTAEQESAVRAALRCPLSVITGGPGTGKTATIRAIAALATEQNAKLLLCAPTGRAAARMRESSGFDASTVHSALSWIPGEGPERDADDPLKCDLLILDETSMANMELMTAVLRAVPAGCHVVLVGDADQLAPVGAGKPFAELVGSDGVPTTRLTHIFRQAAGSMIVQGAHAIRRGELPSFVAADGMRRDLFLIERASAKAARDEIVSLVSERLPAHYGVDAVNDIQVFAPVYRGELGIDALNTALREALNPRGTAVRGGRLRLGDKLMMTGRNLHELRLMNGTLLRLIDEIGGRPRRGGGRSDSGGGNEEDEERDDSALLLEGDDGTIFRLPPEEADRLALAYACSVHRGQGIELPIAVIVAHPAAGAFFLRREMLYTAVTRARLATIIVGVPGVLARAARTPDTDRRHTRLGARLRENAPDGAAASEASADGATASG